ncbi:hypothetical protein C8Q77DRAFT_1164747 [Trametes polyzona]|nr:hypothetical protein C8Q77DRAFT_1164747 [Trametes polyzona]
MAAFTVKATYRSETRKFTFADPLFPTYDQLYRQLYRVFPISHSFYLSKLLFCPKDALGRVLIGKEVHSEEEYTRHVAPYQGRPWPGALLRFSVFDETPHKSPRMAPIISLDDSSAPLSDFDMRESVATESDNTSRRSTATVTESTADVRSQLRVENARQLLLQRIRERTSNRSSQPSHNLPPTPPQSSRPTSMAESSSSRPTSFIEEGDSTERGSLPRRSGTSTLSSASTRTIRPSLFELLGNTPSRTSVPQVEKGPVQPSAQVLPVAESIAEGDKHPSKDREPKAKSSVATSMPSIWERISPPHLPSINELALPSSSTFVAPPPPILFSSTRVNRSVPVGSEDADMVFPPWRPGLRTSPAEQTHPSAQQAQAQQSDRFSPGAGCTRPTAQSTATDKATPSVRDTRPCCSVAQSKEDIKALMERFQQDFREKMAKTFGPDWDKDWDVNTSGARQRSSDSNHSRPAPRPAWMPAAYPSLPHFVQPPPPPPLYMPPPPPPPCIPPPPPPCVVPPPPMTFVPPPPMPPPRPMVSYAHETATGTTSRPRRLSYSPPPIPHVAFAPTRESARGQDTPRDERRDHEDNMHRGVSCDNCGKRHIKGIRYKCLECNDYDLCEGCMASPKVWGSHDRSHAFFPIHTKEDFVDFCVVKEKRQGAQVVHKGITCDGCGKENITGVRHKCLGCDDYDICETCVSDPRKRQEHNLAHSFFPIVVPGNKEAFYEALARLHLESTPSAAGAVATHHGIHCDGCGKRPIVGVRHKCLDCPDYDLCTDCISNPGRRSKHNASHAFFPVTIPGELMGYQAALARSNRSRSPRNDHRPSFPQSLDDRGPLEAQLDAAQPVHKNIVCDVCRREIVGVRNKCLDCPDYDLCQACLTTPTLRSQHHPEHQFFGIEKPGEVIVHTVFSGEDEPRRPQRTSSHDSVPRHRARDVEPVVHNAMCNLCDSRIRGDRFKCLECPDYDLCQLCYKIVNDQHPGHGFVKVSEPATLMLRDRSKDVVHLASCNVCGHVITGVRYKCMHETCEDFDLCQSCEAHPIPVHPVTHPLLKIRSPDTKIPTTFTSSLRTGVTEDPFVDTPVFERSRFSPEALESPRDSQTFARCAPPPPQVRPLPEVTPEMQQNTLSLGPFPGPEMPPFYITSLPSPPPASNTFWSPPVSRVMTPRTATPIMENPFENAIEMPETYGLPQPSPTPPQIVDPAVDLFKRVSSVAEAVAQPPAAAEASLIDFDEPAAAPEEPSAEQEGNAESPMDSFTTPSDIPVSSPSSSTVPKLGPVVPEWSELWPEVTSLLKHLLQPPASPAGVPAQGATSGHGLAMPGGMNAEEHKVEEPRKLDRDEMQVHVDMAPATVESPLVGEPLLCRPLMPERPTNPFTTGRRLSDLILGAPPVRTAARNVRESIDRLVAPPQYRPPLPHPLLATFVSDNNIPDGQIFPPGAEFVKSWRMKNEGTVDWPESTELVFVAGDRLAPREGAPIKVLIGAVKAGEEVEVVAGEMKAPEVPGKYVSSWRLSDGKGNLFGHSVWVDITVAELNESSSESLAASSVIMPQAAQPEATRSTIEFVPTRYSTPSITVPSFPPSEGSSSVSLVDVPSSNSSASDDAMYEDSRSRVLVSPPLVPQDIEYVMLFDSSSEDD